MQNLLTPIALSDRVKQLQFLRPILLLFLVTLPCIGFAAPANIHITIQGISGPSLKNVQTRLSQVQQGLTFNDLKQISVLNAQMQIQIQQALQAYGYFRPRIYSQVAIKNNILFIRYSIQAGPLLKISHIQLQMIGPGKQVLQSLLNNFPLNPGQVLLTENYNNAKQYWLETAEKYGYLQAKFLQHQIKIDLKRYTADLILTFDTGPRYAFGKVHFAKTPFRSTFLQRYVHFKPNQAYSSQQLLNLQDALNSSGYFQRVAVIPDRDNPENTIIPIRVELLPRKSQQYSLGIGYGTDTGIRSSLGWEWRRVTDTGHRFSAQMTASQLQNSLLAQYIIPGRDPVTDQYSIRSSLQNYQYRQGESHIQQIGGTYLTSHDSWQWSSFINYQRERFHLNTAPYVTSYLLIPGINLMWLQSDKHLNPSQGYKISVNLQGASNTLLSSTSFAQIEVQGKIIQPINDNSRVIARSDIGYTSVHDLNLLPLSLRFYAGGAQSVRGFAYQSLGPGRYLFTGSIEYQHRIKGDWNWVSFLDVGNAVNEFATSHTAGYSGFLQRGAGMGLVWHSPVGALQLSIAKALSKEGQPWQVQFSMGPEL